MFVSTFALSTCDSKSISVKRPDEGKMTEVRVLCVLSFAPLVDHMPPPPTPQEKQNIVIVSFVENRQYNYAMG